MQLKLDKRFWVVITCIIVVFTIFIVGRKDVYKRQVPAGKKVEHLIINGVECEPYLTSDHRVMLERRKPFWTL